MAFVSKFDRSDSKNWIKSKFVSLLSLKRSSINSQSSLLEYKPTVALASEDVCTPSENDELKISFKFHRTKWDDDRSMDDSVPSSSSTSNSSAWRSSFTRSASFNGLFGAAMSANSTLAMPTIGGLLLHLDSPLSFRPVEENWLFDNEVLGRSDSPIPATSRESACDMQSAGGAAGEDKVQVVCSEGDGWLYCGVYDGFNGRDVADYMSDNLLKSMMQQLREVEADMLSPRVSSSILRDEDSVDDIIAALQMAVLQTESDYLSMAEEKMAACPELAYSGCCLLSLLIIGRRLFSINVGDSRAVLATHRLPPGSEARDGLYAVQLSRDHSVGDEGERARLQAEHPDEDDLLTRMRLKGKLRVSRAMGAGYLKHPKFNDRLPKMMRIPNLKSPPYLSPRPHISFHELCCEDQFVVMGSDGLFDFFSNDELVASLAAFMAAHPSQDPAKFVLEQTLHKAAMKAAMTVEELKMVPPGEDRRKYHDDVTVLVINLGCGDRVSTASTTC